MTRDDDERSGGGALLAVIVGLALLMLLLVGGGAGGYLYLRRQAQLTAMELEMLMRQEEALAMQVQAQSASNSAAQNAAGLVIEIDSTGAYCVGGQVHSLEELESLITTKQVVIRHSPDAPASNVEAVVELCDELEVTTKVETLEVK